MHGTDYDEPSRPEKSLVIQPTDEWVTSMFGTARGSGNGSSITSIGFTTSRGRIFGPFGAGSGNPFSVFGLLLGLYGALDNKYLSGIGAWYTPVATSIPGVVMFPRSLDRSPAYGNLNNAWTWDDAPDNSGVPPPSLTMWCTVGAEGRFFLLPTCIFAGICTECVTDRVLSIVGQLC
jgi:hypothetical protein